MAWGNIGAAMAGSFRFADDGGHVDARTVRAQFPAPGGACDTRAVEILIAPASRPHQRAGRMPVLQKPHTLVFDYSCRHLDGWLTTGDVLGQNQLAGFNPYFRQVEEEQERDAHAGHRAD